MHEQAPKAFYFDRVSPAIIVMAEWAKEKGALVLFEPASISEDVLFERAVESCHILKFSEERFGEDSELRRAHGPQLIVTTMGAQGLHARWKGRWSTLNAFVAPEVVDAAGAGDWCSVGLMHVLAQKGAAGLTGARKADVERALRLGQALAALNCGFEGARGLMYASQTVERLDRMLRTASGGAGALHEEEINPTPRDSVKVCTICSDATKDGGVTNKAVEEKT